MSSNNSKEFQALWGPNGTEIFPSPNYKFPADQQIFLYVNALVRLFVGIFGILSNGFLIHITRKYKNELCSTCCRLLAVNALYDCLIAASTFTTMALTPLGWNVTFGICFWLNAVPSAAFNASFVMIFLIAADRLLATFFPVWHHLRLNTRRYVAILSGISALMGVGLFIFVSSLIPTQMDQPMFKCQLSDAWSTSLDPIQFSCISFTIPAIFCYCLIWAKFKFDPSIGPSNGQHHQKGIHKSLAILVLIILFCLVLSWAFKFAIRTAIPQPIPLGYISTNVPNLFITLNGAVNIVVLYICSKLYRQIIRRELSKMFKFLPSANSNVQSQVVKNVHYSTQFHMPIRMPPNPHSGQQFLQN